MDSLCRFPEKSGPKWNRIGGCLSMKYIHLIIYDLHSRKVYVYHLRRLRNVAGWYKGEVGK